MFFYTELEGVELKLNGSQSTKVHLHLCYIYCLTSSLTFCVKTFWHEIYYICTYLPTFYLLLFIIEYSHFFQRLHNYAPNFFYGLTANDLFLCNYIIEVRVSICDHDKNFYLFFTSPFLWQNFYFCVWSKLGTSP